MSIIKIYLFELHYFHHRLMNIPELRDTMNTMSREMMKVILCLIYYISIYRFLFLIMFILQYRMA